MANERVLIIDDSVQNVDFLTGYVLEPNGYQVLVARDGEQGLNMALEQRPDLILLDLKMPRMTGLEVLDALNAQQVNIPVIVMTFHGSETMAVEAFRKGSKDYILKPFEISEILNAMGRALTEVRLRKERDELTQRLLASNRQLEQRLKELSTLFGIGKSVTSLLDQDKLLSRLVEAAIYLTNAEEGALLLVDNKTDELYMVAARGIDERLVRSFRVRVNDSLAGEVITTGQPVILAGEDFTEINASYRVRSLMYVPLKVKGRVSGVLSVDNRYQERDFTNHDLRLLSTLADYAAITLENARLFNQAESERSKLATVLGEIEEPVVIITGPDDRLAVANTAFRRTFGLDTTLVENQLLTELLQNQPLLEFIANASDTNNSHKGEISLDDGRMFYATLMPIPDVGRAIIMQDVTHLKELDRMKSDFVSTMSYDLRTPLSSIKEYAQKLSITGELNEKQKLFVDRITNGVEHVTTLIDGLLDLSTIEVDLDPNVSVVDIGRLTAEAVTEFQDQASRKRQQLIYHKPDQPAPVAGNEGRLRQVINNLIDNAVKYTWEEGQISR
jgi:two-component system NtrC family sensor kinase